MGISMAGRDPTARRSQNKALLNQKRLQYILNRAALLGQCRGQTIHPHGATIELLDHSEQQPAIQMVKTLGVHGQQIECRLGRPAGHRAIGLYLCIVSNTSQQAVSDTRRASGTLSN